jgi:hypothetical protein
MPATAIHIVLSLATLGDATQIGLFLFMSLCPRWPRQVSNDCHCHWHYRVTFANVNDPLSLILLSDIYIGRFCYINIHHYAIVLLALNTLIAKLEMILFVLTCLRKPRLLGWCNSVAIPPTFSVSSFADVNVTWYVLNSKF